MSKAVDPVLPIELFPEEYASLIQFYDIIDKLFCFLKSSNSRTTVSHLHQMVQQLGISIPSSNDFTGCTVALLHCKLDQIAQVCPAIVSLSLPEDDMNAPMRDYVFDYIAHSGITKRQLGIRRLRIVAAFSSYLCSYYVRFVLNKIPVVQAEVKRVTKEIIASGAWPNSFNAADIQLPISIACPMKSVGGTNALVDVSNPNLTTDSSSCRVSSTISRALEYLKSNDYKNQIAHVEIFPSRPATFASLLKPLPEVLRAAIKSVCSIESFYSHQATAIDALRNGSHLSLSTSTSSGKSAVYNIPVLESILTDNNATALYIFPTKVRLLKRNYIVSF